MPIYTYMRESTGEVRDIFQGMKDVHEYRGFDGDEDDWKRVFYPPNAAIDTKIDPDSSKQFIDKTYSKKGTVGDLLDLSSELSEKRAADRGGKDPVKQKYFDDYAKKRKGKRHLKEKTSFETDKVKVDYSD